VQHHDVRSVHLEECNDLVMTVISVRGKMQNVKPLLHQYQAHPLSPVRKSLHACKGLVSVYFNLHLSLKRSSYISQCHIHCMYSTYAILHTYTPPFSIVKYSEGSHIWRGWKNSCNQYWRKIPVVLWEEECVNNKRHRRLNWNNATVSLSYSTSFYINTSSTRL
jgi:hypothetical protein